MQDKRKDPRKKLVAFTPVYTLNPKTLIGYLEDLTVRGARVVGSTALEADTIVTLSIHFPEDAPLIEGKPFHIQARVAQVHTDDTRYENLGFEFINVTTEHAAILDAIIQRYEFHRSI